MRNLEKARSNNEQLSAEILDYQNGSEKKQKELDELERNLKSLTIEYQEMKQKVCVQHFFITFNVNV